MDIVPQLIINSLIAGSVYTLMAIGFQLIYSTTKFFNLTHGVIAAVGGYTALYVSQKFGAPLWIGAVCAVMVAGCGGMALEKVIYAPLRKRKASHLVQLVASLGAFTMIQAIIAILFTSQFFTLSLFIPQQTTIEIGGGVLTTVQVLMIASVLIITGVLLYVLYKTPFGRMVRAVSDDEEVATVIGIRTDRVILWLMGIGSAIAGFAGVLIGIDTGIEPTMGMNLLLKGAIATIVGGISSLSGAVLGGFLLGFVENFGIWKIAGEWKDAIAFVLLIVFLLFRPQGIIKR